MINDIKRISGIQKPDGKIKAGNVAGKDKSGEALPGDYTTIRKGDRETFPLDMKNAGKGIVNEETVPATKGEPEKADWCIGPFRKFKNPIMEPSEEGFDSRNIYNMATIKEGDTFYMIYRGEAKGETAKDCTGRLGLAISHDGKNFIRYPKPILVPDKPYEKQGIEDPRLIKVEDKYYLSYTAYDGDTAKLCLATSKDLVNWEKKGPLFPKLPYDDIVGKENWSKSGAILPEKIKEGPFKDKYIMYFGESYMWMGYSDDLEHWDYVKEPVIGPREGKFDSRMVEPGPPPIMTKDGILLIYNSSDKPKKEGELFGSYQAGAVLFDPKDPTKVLKRSEKPIIEPTQDWEIDGYVDNVVFAEGLVAHDGKWNLYYGGADHKIGLAQAEFRPEQLLEGPVTSSLGAAHPVSAVGLAGTGVYEPREK